MERFILAEDSNGLFSIFDNEDSENEPLLYGAEFGTEEIVVLLNKLNNENKTLKKEVETLQKKIDLLCEVFDYGSDESIRKMKKVKQK